MIVESSTRFYPDFYPSFQHEPTMDKFKIIKSDEVGEGVIALNTFDPGQIIFRFSGLILNDMTLFTLQLGIGQHIHDPFFMGKILHSCDPNTDCDMATQTFTAIKPIKPGEYLTMDYETTEDELFRSFECHCGSPNCKKFIMGKKYRMALQLEGNIQHMTMSEP
jgi:tyrocidine synthetase-3